MLKGFKEFILRGNVIDLAVAVVIGAAFTNIVNVVVTGVIDPAIGALFSTATLAKSLPVTRDGGDASAVHEVPSYTAKPCWARLTVRQ